MKNTHRRTSLIVLLLTVLSVAPGCNARTVGSNETRGNSRREAGSVSAIRSMTTRRAAHTATPLADGKVLITGGFTGEEETLASAEVFDPATGTFTSTGNMNAPRASHTATALPTGKVLIAGGYNGSYLASAELYDPTTRRFTLVSNMVTARSGHVAMLLRNGKVVLAGGTGVGWTFLAEAELYDPSAGTFTATGSMTTARESHTATLLANGKVLIVGGHRGRRPSITIHSSAEIYDPAAGTFTAAGNMTRRRHKHEAIALTDGRVLIAGGSDERDGHGAYTSAEIYDSTKGTFTDIGNMNAARYKLQGTLVLLTDGRVLIAGGANRAEVFDPATNNFFFASGDLGTARLFAAATRLQNGQVLITGGYDDNNAVSSNAWIYRT